MSQLFLTLSCLIVFMHSFLSFILIYRTFPAPKYFWVVMPIFCTFNTAIFISSLQIFRGSEFLAQYFNEMLYINTPYLGICLLFLVEVFILFHNAKAYIITISLGVILHFLVFRSIVVSLFALSLSTSMQNVVSNWDLLLYSSVGTFALHIVILIIFMVAIPTRLIKIIAVSSDLLLFIAVLIILECMFLIYNGTMLHSPIESVQLAILQITLPLFLLVIFYIGLLMMFRIIVLHDYKNKTAELENEITKDAAFRNTLFSQAEMISEFNCSTNKLLRLVVNGEDIVPIPEINYSTYIKKTTMNCAHPNNLNELEIMSPNALISLFAKGERELSYDYKACQVNFKGFEDAELSSASPNREYSWHRLNITLREDPNTEELLGILSVYNIQEEKEAELALRQDATLDALTGAYNRKHGELLINNHIDAHNTGTLFMIDLDNFKSVNDKMGHAKGDEVLRNVFTDVCSIFKSSDIIARVGGDEFIAFMTSSPSIDLIESKSRLLCDKIIQTFTTDSGEDITISASVGVSICPKDGLYYSHLFNKADIAMYISKNNGKNNFTIFDEDTHLKTNKHNPITEIDSPSLIDDANGYTINTNIK